MLQRCVAALALAQAAVAMQADPALVALGGRRLQRTGAVESNVCGRRSASAGGDRLTNTCDASGRVGGAGTPCRNGHTALMGTIHDDGESESPTQAHGFLQHLRAACTSRAAAPTRCW